MYLSLIKGHLFAEMCVVADEVSVPFLLIYKFLTWKTVLLYVVKRLSWRF